VIKPPRGMIFLEKLKKGEMFETAGLKGVKIKTGPMGTNVIIISANLPEDDQPYYLGKHLFANKTAVKRSK